MFYLICPSSPRSGSKASVWAEGFLLWGLQLFWPVLLYLDWWSNLRKNLPNTMFLFFFSPCHQHCLSKHALFYESPRFSNWFVRVGLETATSMCCQKTNKHCCSVKVVILVCRCATVILKGHIQRPVIEATRRHNPEGEFFSFPCHGCTVLGAVCVYITVYNNTKLHYWRKRNTSDKHWL